MIRFGFARTKPVDLYTYTSNNQLFRLFLAESMGIYLRLLSESIGIFDWFMSESIGNLVGPGIINNESLRSFVLKLKPGRQSHRRSR